MKKFVPVIMIMFVSLISGCTIDYDSYYEKYGDVSNKDDRLNSVKIDETVVNYPSSNESLLDKYSQLYEEVSSDYEVYSTYYSSLYDTIYISYDNKNDHVQTIKSKELALIEEHLLNYFEMDENKEVYKDYLKVVRVYPDYASSVCRGNGDSEEIYSKIEGCASYDAIEGSINLNGLVNIDRFFKPYTYIENNIQYRVEPKRDAFAHEFGHVSTYYYMVLKGDGSYEDYLRLRLGNQYDIIYKDGLPDSYSSNDGYDTQPVEILADDYVELYYNTSKKVSNDYYNYELEYEDLRNSLAGVSNVTKFLKDDTQLFNTIRDYYDLYLNRDYQDYETKKVVTFNGSVFTSIHDVIDNEVSKQLLGKELIVLGEVSINDTQYYRVILSNVISKIDIRQEYNNIGYVLVNDCLDTSDSVIYFDYYNEPLTPGVYLPIEEKNVYLIPFYDFSYFIYKDNKIKIYNYLNDDFGEAYINSSYFIDE